MKKKVLFLASLCLGASLLANSGHFNALPFEVSESTVAEEWTRSAENALFDGTAHDISAQVRRDIIQAVITDYIFNKLGKANDLQKWTLEGGLR